MARLSVFSFLTLGLLSLGALVGCRVPFSKNPGIYTVLPLPKEERFQKDFGENRPLYSGEQKVAPRYSPELLDQTLVQGAHGSAPVVDVATLSQWLKKQPDEYVVLDLNKASDRAIFLGVPGALVVNPEDISESFLKRQKNRYLIFYDLDEQDTKAEDLCKKAQHLGLNSRRLIGGLRAWDSSLRDDKGALKP